MYYHPRDHIYITQFRDEIILLDTKSDSYTVCFKQFSSLLNDILEKNTTYLKNTLKFSGSRELPQELAYIQKLLDDRIIESNDNPYPFHIDRKLLSKGVSNVDWRLPLENKNASWNIQVLKAFWTLIKVNFYMKVKGFYQTIQLIKSSRNHKNYYVVPHADDLQELASIVNQACIMYPTRTKCLEWAVTYILLALKKKWKCNLEIGIQNYPFFAHAWVECDGKIVMDNQDLREGLAIVLNEPFRKLKI